MAVAPEWKTSRPFRGWTGLKVPTIGFPSWNLSSEKARSCRQREAALKLRHIGSFVAVSNLNLFMLTCSALRGMGLSKRVQTTDSVHEGVVREPLYR